MRRGRLLILLLCAVIAGCGTRSAHTASPTAPAASAPAPPTSTAAAVPRAHPQAIQPVAGAAAAPAAPSQAPQGPQAAQASQAPQAGVSVGPPSPSLPEPVTVTQVRQELAQSGMTASTDQATLTAGGLAVAPVNVPGAVQAVIAAGNEIARLPYVWGGGHMTYEDTGYDCSGSISYVFAAAHLLSSTVTSGELANYGQPGPGKWITIFANAGHTFMIIAGLRFDTVALAETGSRWSNRRPDENLSTFAVRHPAGL